MIYSIYPNESGVKHGLHVIIVLGWIPDRHTFRRPCWEWNKMTKRFPSRLDLNEDLLLVRPIVNRFVAIQCTKEWPRTLYMSWMTAIYTCVYVHDIAWMHEHKTTDAITHWPMCKDNLTSLSVVCTHTHTRRQHVLSQWRNITFPINIMETIQNLYSEISSLYKKFVVDPIISTPIPHYILSSTYLYQCVQTSSPSWSYSTISWGQTTNFQPKILPRNAFFFNLLQASLAVLRQMFWSWGLATYNTTRNFHKKNRQRQTIYCEFSG